MQRNISRYGVAAFITVAIIVCDSAGRDLRPSDHGLAYQQSASPAPRSQNSGEMLSFFGSTAVSEVPLPEADDIGDDAGWSVHGGRGSRDVRRDHVRIGLLVASCVFGTAGVVLLVVSGVVLLVRLRKRTAAAAAAATAERLAVNHEVQAVNDK